MPQADPAPAPSPEQQDEALRRLEAERDAAQRDAEQARRRAELSEKAAKHAWKELRDKEEKKGTTSTEPQRLTISLAPRVMVALEQLADRYGVTKSEAVRKALATEVWRVAVEDEGGHFFVEKGGVRERVHFPY